MKPEVLASGLQFGESPRWHAGRLWVCDWLAGAVLTFDEGSPQVVARVEGMPFSIDWLPDGRMVMTTPDGLLAGPDLVPYSATAKGYNEVVVAGHFVYVNRPGSMPWEERAPGIVSVVAADGSCREVAGDVWFPNGMAVTAEGSTLLVAESHADRITAFTIEEDGSLSERRVWAELGSKSAPDGICLDADGALWYASVPRRWCRRVAEGGEVLATVDVGQPAFACMLGDPDGRTLFITANDFGDDGSVSNGRVLRVRVDTPHSGHP